MKNEGSSNNAPVTEKTGSAAEVKENIQTAGQDYLYEKKASLVTKNEMLYLEALRKVLPKGYIAIPQSNLASFITRTDGAKYQNELFRNVDFLITDKDYVPYFVIEINDETHNTSKRRERDVKIKLICEESGIEIITLWTSYGVNEEYIRSRIEKAIKNYPPQRFHHFVTEPEQDTTDIKPIQNTFDTEHSQNTFAAVTDTHAGHTASKEKNKNKKWLIYSVAAIILSNISIIASCSSGSKLSNNDTLGGFVLLLCLIAVGLAVFALIKKNRYKALDALRLSVIPLLFSLLCFF